MYATMMIAFALALALVVDEGTRDEVYPMKMLISDDGCLLTCMGPVLNTVRYGTVLEMTDPGPLGCCEDWIALSSSSLLLLHLTFENNLPVVLQLSPAILMSNAHTHSHFGDTVMHHNNAGRLVTYDLLSPES